MVNFIICKLYSNDLTFGVKKKRLIFVIKRTG